MKINAVTAPMMVAAVAVLGLTLFTPETGFAGEYEDALAVVEGAYGPVADSNPFGPGSVDWQVIDLAIAAKASASSGDEASAVAAMEV